MINIKNKKQLKKYTDKDGNIEFNDDVNIDIDIYSDGSICSNGNICSNGSIHSNGNIYSGGSISSKGYIYSGGNISSDGKIYSEGNIFSDGKIYSGGNIFSEGNIYSGRNIEGNIAMVFGVKTKTFFSITSHKYNIQISDKHIKIGCKLHTKAEWKKFTRKEISQMNYGAWDWWKANKKWILSL